MLEKELTLRRYLIALTIFLFLLVSCAPAAPSLEEIQATADSLAATGVLQTLAAQPTDTQEPTATLAPTLEPSATNTVPELVTASPTVSGFVASGTQANVAPTTVSATELANKKDNSTAVKLQNNTDQIIWIIIEGPGYWEYRFSDSFVILLPLGQYHYRAWIGDSGPYEGNFHIGNPDKHTFVFSNGKVDFQGP
jgi:hypothetical protein